MSNLLNTLDWKLIQLRTAILRTTEGGAGTTDTGTGDGNNAGDAAASFLDGFGNASENDGVLGQATQSAKTLGNSIYSLIFYLVIMAAAIAILLNALRLIFGGAQGKAEGKTSLLWIAVAVALAAGAISLVKLIAMGTAGLF